MSHAVVVVPGTMGSRLSLAGREVWPGSVLDLLRHFDAAEMEALLDPALEATDLIRRYFISTQYQALLDDLERYGFHEHARPATLYPFAYDWRRDNADTAGRLADRLDAVAAEHPGGVEISLVAHSMGGLVARYLLESGRFDGRPGRDAVRLLVTLGTPHRGAPEALPVVLGLEGRLWLTGAQASRLARDPRYPSAYQLLPRHGEPFAWDEDPGHRLAPIDVYHDAVAERLGLIRDNLAAARRLHAGMPGPASGVRYFCFAGTRHSTASLVRVRRVSEHASRVRAIEPDDSGDGTVPDWSARLPGVQGLAVGGEHATLYRTGDVRRTLGVLLGARATLSPAELPGVELALRERFVAPRQAVRGVLSFPGTPVLRGELRVWRATGAPHDPELTPIGQPHAVEYRGVAVDGVSLVFEAPGPRGAYRVGFVPEGSEAPAGWDELFVIGDRA